ncbi:NUDIX domain-containing protein [Pseudofrankia sp. BMG5.36]|uniref:NUDIX domain-containing protein n=1 Tax=Pseudofrankia sp. BMG5.36 TaxID=1834512 RepID=UPI0008D930B1|nr:NUDIX domain-containing protein [Pseudofrankia sp. BMG5.36]OHV66825.1 NUDIX hydrolase [Pseudofrankia sp. BMG5.36]
MARRDFYDDPAAPKPNSIVPAATAVVPDGQGRVLLIRRSDNGKWALPGGQMDVGERLADSAVREVKEETGLDVEVVRILGLYSDPRHVIAYDDGEVRQQFAVCFETRVLGGQLLADGSEAKDARFFSRADLADLNIHPSIRLRIDHHWEKRPEPYIG